MSTAMVITHRANKHEEQRIKSEQVQRRAIYLFYLLKSSRNGQAFIDELGLLLGAIDSQSGDYADFLNRWQYDETQRHAIKSVLMKLIER